MPDEINICLINPNTSISMTTVIEGALHQRFFAKHLPRLTDCLDGEDSIVKFYQELVIKEITK